jgi:hypothetical protein
MASPGGISICRRIAESTRPRRRYKQHSPALSLSVFSKPWRWRMSKSQARPGCQTRFVSRSKANPSPALPLTREGAFSPPLSRGVRGVSLSGATVGLLISILIPRAFTHAVSGGVEGAEWAGLDISSFHVVSCLWLASDCIFPFHFRYAIHRFTE